MYVLTYFDLSTIFQLGQIRKKLNLFSGRIMIFSEMHSYSIQGGDPDPDFFLGSRFLKCRLRAIFTNLIKSLID